MTCGDVTNSKKVATCSYFSNITSPVTLFPCAVQNVVLCANAKGECFLIDVAEQVSGEMRAGSAGPVGGAVLVLWVGQCWSCGWGSAGPVGGEVLVLWVGKC